jgi:lysophospholipase L1-like esterase
VREDPLEGLTSETYWSLQRRTYERRGFFALPGTHGGRWNVEEPPPQLILPEWDDAIRALARQCDESGVALLILFSPIWDGLSHARDFSQLDRWARELEATYPRVTAARPIVRFYVRSFMWDGLHLNAAGVERNMPVVAKAVEAALSK